MKNSQFLELDRCPHCGIAKPSLETRGHIQTKDHAGRQNRYWFFYTCASCGGATMTEADALPNNTSGEVLRMWPAQDTVSETVPQRARDFLSQAMASLHAPSGAVMLCASSVDAMLKDKGYKQGSLNTRIDQAAAAHIITPEMAAWAHEIRLDANDERHADENAALPSEADARKAIEFAQALAQFLFVLPARVERGRKKT